MADYLRTTRMIAALYPSAAFYSPDLLAMSLGQQANGILPQLDRQLVFGAYGGMDQSINGQSVLDGMGWDGPSHGSSSAHRASQSTNAGEGQPSRTAGSSDAMHVFGHGHEASSAWFMPFNMEPPEIGQEMGGGMGNLDQFASMFGGNGMTTPGGGMGGLHHNGH